MNRQYIWYREYIIWPKQIDDVWCCEITDSACGDIAITDEHLTREEAIEQAKQLIDQLGGSHG